MPRKILFGNDLHKECETTINIINKAVSSSLGPSGKLTLMDRPNQSSLISKDGVSIANSLCPLPNDVHNAIAEKVLEIARTTNVEAGDGTTCSIVLTHALYTEAKKYMKEFDPVIIAREIEAEASKIRDQLNKMAKPVTTLEDMIRVSTISANNDRSMGEIVAKALDAVGQDGFVTVTETDEPESYYSITEGYEIKKGAFNDRYLKDEVKREFENPFILAYDGKLSNVSTLYQAIEMSKGKPFVFIGELDEKCIEFAIQNVKANRLTFVHIEPPFKKSLRVKHLKDICAVVGAKLVSDDHFRVSNNPEIIMPEAFGSAEKVIFTKDITRIVKGKGSKQEILARISDLKNELEASKTDFDRNEIKKRIGSLSAGVAVIHVGDKTQEALKEKRDRFEDAVNACRSAMQEGIIPGGGFALFKIAQKMKAKTVGQKILKAALEYPLRTIVRNTGKDIDEVVARVRAGRKGYDARNHKYVDLMKVGIVDPVKSTKAGLKNAVSIVDLLINLEVLSIISLDKDNVKEMTEVMKGMIPGQN